jgi:hypothetical protein
MSRAINIALEEAHVLSVCDVENVGVSAIQKLPQGGVRLVCMSMDGADRMRRKFKVHLLAGEVIRERSRLW